MRKQWRREFYYRAQEKKWLFHPSQYQPTLFTDATSCPLTCVSKTQTTSLSTSMFLCHSFLCHFWPSCSSSQCLIILNSINTTKLKIDYSLKCCFNENEKIHYWRFNTYCPFPKVLFKQKLYEWNIFKGNIKSYFTCYIKYDIKNGQLTEFLCPFS